MRNGESDMRDRHENTGIIVTRVPEEKGRGTQEQENEEDEKQNR